MDWVSAALLGVVQGLTEFLPVSSSAHLVLARMFFGWNVEEGTFGLAFDVALHAGTLLAILVYFRAEIAEILAAAPSAFTAAAEGKAKVARSVMIGTIPIVILGGAAASWLEENARTPFVIVITLVIGALWMMAAERLGSKDRTEESLSTAGATLVGVAQATALVPGMSRSGSTMSMAMLLGLTRESAARYSFLLGVPAMAGAAAKEGQKVLRMGVTAHDAALFALGMTVSAAVGYATIRFFLRYLTGHSLDVFAYYRLALAAATIYWLFGR